MQNTTGNQSTLMEFAHGSAKYMSGIYKLYLKYKWPQVRIISVFIASVAGGKYAEVQFYPMGVIGCIVPWNYPFHNFFSHAVSAIFTGNGVVVKCSEGASWCRRYYLELFQYVLRRRGHDPNLVQLIAG